MRTDEQITDATERDVARPLSPIERAAAFFGGRLAGGKDRKAANPAPGTKPRLPVAIAATLQGHRGHQKLRGRKSAKAARRAAQPHVKRHARSRAHRGHGHTK